MKNLRAKKPVFTLLVVLSVLMTSASYEECECKSDHADSCNAEARTVKKASNEIGFVAYNEEEGKWMIVRSIAGTYDSQDLGILCDSLSLPEEFRQIGMRVLFSGEYKNYNKDPKGLLAGQTFYYLHLSTIEEE